MLQAKWDGFRFIVDVGAGADVRGWSRHGTDLTARVGSLLAPFAGVAPGTTFDGELVALGERDGRPAQDFAAVTRAVFTGATVAVAHSVRARAPPEGARGQLQEGPEEQVREELRLRGLPEPQSIALIRGSSHRFRSARVGQSRLQRARVFGVALEFDQPVRGPIVIGALCHFGLGVFTPTEER